MPPNKAPIPAASKEAVQTRQALMTPSAIDGSLGGRDEYALIVYEDLGPTRQSQKTKDLRLDLNGDIEFLSSWSQHLIPSTCCAPSFPISQHKIGG